MVHLASNFTIWRNVINDTPNIIMGHIDTNDTKRLRYSRALLGNHGILMTNIRSHAGIGLEDLQTLDDLLAGLEGRVA